MTDSIENHDGVDSGIPQAELLEMVAQAAVNGTHLRTGVTKGELQFVLEKLLSLQKETSFHPDAMATIESDLMDQFTNDSEAQTLIHKTLRGTKE